MRLIIAEKPSVAMEIARVVCAPTRRNGYLEGENDVISWCMGHLVELAKPEAYDAKYQKWRLEDLPILPKRWQYEILSSTAKQFQVLKSLMHDRRMESVVCATDAGREGELIFRLVYEQVQCHLPVQRLWISSLEEEAIREGMNRLSGSHTYDALYAAALCRERADWLMGMNASRLYSLLYGQTLRIGRVMTPTLALMVKREEAIARFSPKAFYTVQLTLEQGVSVQSARYESREEAERVLALCSPGSAMVQSFTRTPRKEQPPLLYDLTTLQRDANRFLGYTAQQTLDYAQTLYEHKLITYPRTDSRYLPESMRASVQQLAEALGCDHAHACNITRLLRNEGVTDHHAILPTGLVPRQPETIQQLSATQRKLLEMICCRLRCALAEPALYEETRLTVEQNGCVFKAAWNQRTQPGWEVLRQRFLQDFAPKGEHPPAETEETNRPPLTLHEGQEIGIASAQIKEGRTTPPKLYTEDTLLAAMENTQEELSDQEAPSHQEAERRGIGTPATRASILEKLVQAGYVVRTGKDTAQQLLPTQMGKALIAAVPEILQSPRLTAEWEHRLKRIEQGKERAEDFLSDLSEQLKELTRLAAWSPDASNMFPHHPASVGQCPECGATVVEKSCGFFCMNGACHFALWKNHPLLTNRGITLTREMVGHLLSHGQVLVKDIPSKKNGKHYSALLLISEDEQGKSRISVSLPS